MKQKPTISTVKQLMEFDPAPREETIEWIVESGITELADAWDRCPRADWMLWLCNTLDLLSDQERRAYAAAAAAAAKAAEAAADAAYAAAASAAYATQADIVREIVGNPFRDSAAAKGEKQ